MSLDKVNSILFGMTNEWRRKKLIAEIENQDVGPKHTVVQHSGDDTLSKPFKN
ncbi:hypothetical protein ADUPG1_004148, partial [Aduncisulcus paluster]